MIDAGIVDVVVCAAVVLSMATLEHKVFVEQIDCFALLLPSLVL